MPRGKKSDQSATADMSGNESAASQHSQRHTRNHPVGLLAYVPVNQLNQHLRDRREASQLSVVEERAHVEADDNDQAVPQDEPTEELSKSDRMVPISDALVVKRDTVKLDRPQSTIPRPTPIIDLMPTPPHLKSRTTAFTNRPVFELGTSPISKKEEDPITIAPAKESSDSVLNRILSSLERQSGSLEKMSVSIDQQSKSLEHLTIRVDAIEERRSQRSSRSHSRASGRGETKQENDVPAQALESALLNSRE